RRNCGATARTYSIRSPLVRPSSGQNTLSSRDSSTPPGMGRSYPLLPPAATDAFVSPPPPGVGSRRVAPPSPCPPGPAQTPPTPGATLPGRPRRSPVPAAGTAGGQTPCAYNSRQRGVAQLGSALPLGGR